MTTATPILALLAWGAVAATPDWGLNVEAGARVDDVRMCVATPPGALAGPAADVALFVDVPLGERVGLGANLPVFRPLLFATAFQMVQLEPEVWLTLRPLPGARLEPILAPTLGLSVHYGPGARGKAAAPGPEFFAWGPQLGLYAGLRVHRPDRRMELEWGVDSYVARLRARYSTGTVLGVNAHLRLVFAADRR